MDRRVKAVCILSATAMAAWLAICIAAGERYSFSFSWRYFTFGPGYVRVLAGWVVVAIVTIGVVLALRALHAPATLPANPTPARPPRTISRRVAIPLQILSAIVGILLAMWLGQQIFRHY